MFQTLINAFKNKEVRTKILFTLLILFVYRVGCWIPVPGLDTSILAVSEDNTFMTLLNSITGDALANGALLALGISPYINASIIAQLLTIAIPALERWSKQGDEGKRKIAMFTRVLTVVLAVIQAVGTVVSFAAGDGSEGSTYLATSVFSIEMAPAVVGILVGLILVCGAVFAMWRGEKIAGLGIGNGISLLIFVGIVSSAGLAIIDNVGMWGEDANAPWALVIFLLLVIVIFGLIAFIDGAERKIPVQYAKQIKGRKQYGGQSTHIPIKVNSGGVLPIIFATAIITFPQLIMQMFNAMDNWWVSLFGTGQPLYFVLSGLLILFFSYFYAMIQFRPDEVARNLQQYGGFVPGIRPGKATAEYLARVNRRLTLFGAIYLAFVFIVPSVIFAALANSDLGFNYSLTNAFSSTGMLIVVSVALEFQRQLESQLMMRQYKGFLKQ